MSLLDIDIGRFTLTEVNNAREKHGRWPLQEDRKLSEWAWAHIHWMLWQGGGVRHPPNGELDNTQTENIFCGRCQNPYALALYQIHHGDFAHLSNFLREDLSAQGVAVYTTEYFDRYWMILTWRARKIS